MMSPDQFSTGMRKLATSVTVISCSLNGQRYGLTASAVTALSAEPPSLIACVNQAASVHKYIQEAGYFCINILATDQVDVSNAFASQPMETRYDYGQWDMTPNGAPLLINAAANFECSLLDSLPGFTHNIFVGLITHIVTSKADPLLYGNTHYGQFQPHKT